MWAFVYGSKEAKPNKANAVTVENVAIVNSKQEDEQILQMKDKLRKQEQIKKQQYLESEARQRRIVKKQQVKKPYQFKIVSEITAYTNYQESTGKRPGDKGFGITTSGTKTRQYHTIAMSKRYPFGTKVRIEGFGNTIFVVEDRGGAIIGNRIDLYFKSVKDAKKFGRQTRNVYIISLGSEK
jgi:3D (Asp-Asp-Asp) domain-containing protein